MIRHLTLLSVAAILIALAPRAHATTAIELSLDELQDQSSVVIIGEVVSSESYWQGGLIMTDTTLRVLECVQGECGDTVVVTTLGGEVGGIAQGVAGEVRYIPGEEVMSFLNEGRDGNLTPVGMSQGAFHITRVDGAYLAQADLSGLMLVDGPGMPASESMGSVYRLADLVSAVQYRVPAIPLRAAELPSQVAIGE